MAKLKITQVRSTISRSASQKGTLEALGLRGIRKSVIKEDDAIIQGMVNAVSHLVTVEKVD